MSLLPEWLYKKKIIYTSLTNPEYYKKFGISYTDTDGYRVDDREKLEYAYSKAWEIRNYEIDKFWIRAAYFWGFIVLIFGGYTTFITSKPTSYDNKTHTDLYLVLLGLLFSVCWYLNILGSKSWQRNWEAHIDFLEDFISGPIYKTTYSTGRVIYSVSKLNEFMAIIVIFVWLLLITEHLLNNYVFSFNCDLELLPSGSIFLTVIALISLIFGYPSGSIVAKPNTFIDRWEY